MAVDMMWRYCLF